jgi:quinol monooxygenase YgiN
LLNTSQKGIELSCSFISIGAAAMIISTLVLTLREPNRRSVLASLRPLIGSIRGRPGCRACALLHDCEDPRRLMLREEWESEGDLDCHLCSPDYRLILAAIELSEEAPQLHFDTVTARAGLERVEAVRLPRAQ